MNGPPEIRNQMRETEYNRKRFPVNGSDLRDYQIRQIEADKQFQRRLALAYMRGDFPKDCYPDGKVPLILTGG